MEQDDYCGLISGDDDFQFEEDINAREEDPMDETDDDLSEDAGDPWEEWDMGQWD